MRVIECCRKLIRRLLGKASSDLLLRLRGSDKHLWVNEHAGDYVRRLREHWK